MSSEDELVKKGQFGDDVAAFIEGHPIGQYIVACRERDEAEAMEALMSLDPYKYHTLGELQTALAQIQENVVIARKLHGYLGDAIIEGRQADAVLLSQEDNQ